MRIVMRVRKKLYCNRCGGLVVKEREPGLRKEYPFFCPECDENMYRFETHRKSKAALCTQNMGGVVVQFE
jgi:predicted RNA-binding Zn-ribbon protein involved in translation (DUF1610 family)